MAEDKKLIESFCDLEIPSTIKFSPDASKVLYSTQLYWGHSKGKHAVSTLWLASAGQENSSKQITSGLFKDFKPAWTPDGESIAFISDRAGRGERWAIYIMPMQQGGDPFPITPVDNKARIETFEFSPDGKYIAFLSPDEKTPEQIRKLEEGEDVEVWGQDWPYTRLRVVEMKTKTVKSLKIDRNVVGLSWSPDGSEIVITTWTTPDGEDPFLRGSNISTVDVGLTSVKDVCRLPKPARNLTWASDGKLYFIAGIPITEVQTGYCVYALTPGSKSAVYERVDFGVEDDALGLAKANGQVVARVEHELESRICLPGDKVLYSKKEELEAFDVAFKGKTGVVHLAVASSNVSQPVEVFTTTPDGSAMVKITNHGQSLASRQFGTCSFLSSPSADREADIDAFYLSPASNNDSKDGEPPRKPLPTIVLIHGGPNTRLTNSFNAYYLMWTPYLLSRGYGILIPNYRGGRGRGKKFAGYSVGGTGITDYADVISATQHAIEQGYADKDRMVVGGWSHGGFLSFCCSVRNGLHGHGWKFKASISGAGVSDSDAMALESDFGCVYQPDFHFGRVAWNSDRIDTRNRMSASPLWEMKDAAERSKQMGEMVVPPMLIMCGADDPRVPVTQSAGMRRALSSYGLPFEYAIYPRQAHMPHEQKCWIDMALRIGRWCDKYIGSSSPN